MLDKNLSQADKEELLHLLDTDEQDAKNLVATKGPNATRSCTLTQKFCHAQCPFTKGTNLWCQEMIGTRYFTSLEKLAAIRNVRSELEPAGIDLNKPTDFESL